MVKVFMFDDFCYKKSEFIFLSEKVKRIPSYFTITLLLILLSLSTNDIMNRLLALLFLVELEQVFALNTRILLIIASIIIKKQSKFFQFILLFNPICVFICRSKSIKWLILSLINFSLCLYILILSRLADIRR